MNPSLSYVLLLLFIIATQSLVYSTTIPPPPAEIVKDSKGKKVLENVRYHIGPVNPENGGRITLTDTMYDKKVCPFDVVQDPSEGNLGCEFMFTHIGSFEDKYLHISSILGIDSGYPKGECEDSTFWTVPDVEEPPPSSLITTGGGFDDYITCFKIEKYPKPTSSEVPSYMLQHCPSLCGAGPSACFDISIYSDNGVRRLGYTGGTPFEFAFYKVKTTHDNM